jgi:hypothetical protein
MEPATSEQASPPPPASPAPVQDPVAPSLRTSSGVVEDTRGVRLPRHV